VRRVEEEAHRLGLRTRRSRTTSGTERSGKPFSRGHISRLLSNPIYLGRIAAEAGASLAHDRQREARLYPSEPDFDERQQNELPCAKPGWPQQ
jgi:hypothetical protein